MQLRSNTKLPKDGSNLLQYFGQHRRASVKNMNLNRSERRDIQVEIQSRCCQSRFCCSEAEMDRICWAEPSQEFLPFAFCRDTSLHGLKYIGQPERHLVERIFWFLAFLTGVVTACYLINGVWEKFNSSPVIVSFQETDAAIFQIPFPAVTICNVNNVLKSEAEKYQSEGNSKNIALTEHVCTSAAQSYSQKLGYHTSESKKYFDSQPQKSKENKTEKNQDVKEFLRKAAQRCDKMIVKCMWEDKIVENCSDIFQGIETDFGKCCTFNMVSLTLLLVYEYILQTFSSDPSVGTRVRNDTRDKEEEVEYWRLANINMDNLLLPNRSNIPGIPPDKRRPRRVRRSGKSYGLSLLLDPQLDEYFCTTADSNGFQLTTHLPIDVPHVVDNGVAVQPNYETYIRVTPDVTTAAATVADIYLDKRGCYFNGEQSLKYYKYYTVSNCFDECIANLTKDRCKCVRYYMPREANGTLCGAHNFNCTAAVKQELVESGFMSNCTRCLPTCTEITYTTEMSVSPLRTDVDIWMRRDGNSDHWKNKSPAIVHIYFGEDSMYPKIRKELYGLTDLIANTGGLLGLCLGFSVLSLLEVIYFLTIRAWFKVRLKRRTLKLLAARVVGIWQRLRGRLRDPNEDDRVLPFVTQVDYLSTWKANAEKSKQNGNGTADLFVGEVAPYYMNRRSLGSISRGLSPNE